MRLGGQTQSSREEVSVRAATPAADRASPTHEHGPPLALNPGAILALQATIGNRAVRRLLADGGGQPMVQRTTWQATDQLTWAPLDHSDETMALDPPSHPPSQAGEQYDDVTGQTYPPISPAPSGDPWSDDQLSDDLDTDFVFDGADEGTSDSEDDGDGTDSTMDDDGTGHPGSPLPDLYTLESRKQRDEEALRRPRDTSTLRASARGYPRREVSSNVKLKRKGKATMEQRSGASKPMTITLETVELWVNDKRAEYVRPVEIVGLVEATSTTGRGGAPDPLSGTQIYQGQLGQLKGSIPVVRNMGMPDAERGHIMALELGGSDIPENIVPQWAKFQGSGEWRRMEVATLKQAEALPKGQVLRYHVIIYYKEAGPITPTMGSFGVPTGFRATTQILDAMHAPLAAEVEVFNQGQSQDATDNMLSARQMAKIEGPDWDPALDTREAKQKKATTAPRGAKRKKRPKGDEPKKKRRKTDT